MKSFRYIKSSDNPKAKKKKFVYMLHFGHKQSILQLQYLLASEAVYNKLHVLILSEA